MCWTKWRITNRFNFHKFLRTLVRNLLEACRMQKVIQTETACVYKASSRSPRRSSTLCVISICLSQNMKVLPRPKTQLTGLGLRLDPSVAMQFYCIRQHMLNKPIPIHKTPFITRWKIYASKLKTWQPKESGIPVKQDRFPIYTDTKAVMTCASSILDVTQLRMSTLVTFLDSISLPRYASDLNLVCEFDKMMS